MFRPPPVLLANVASYLVVLVLLDRPGLVINHPHEAPRGSSQSGTVGWYKRTGTLKQQSL